VVALVAYVLAADRHRLGLSMGRGESMLIELRDTLARQGEPPPLPASWHADVARRPAGGGSFSGDFLVARLSGDGRRLELALVDVSGKGIDAGTRSLLLSGAFGALLGSVPPEQFLPAANDYVLRQGWFEGFATCIHVSVELASGRYRLGNAGHPPAAQFNGGSGRWSLVDVSGTALGLYDAPPFGRAQGELRPHDALLLFTDGLVEVPGRDLEVGIDRLLGATERMVARGFAGSAELLIDSGASGVNDDRALVLLWRTV
jgi:serine phosphatase RsbU (regulator of sigma subunit)